MTKPVKKKKLYSIHNLSAASAAIKNGMAVKRAAREFNVPRSTLQHKFTKYKKTLVRTSVSTEETVRTHLSDRRSTSQKEEVLNSLGEFKMQTPATEDKKPLPKRDLCRVCMKSLSEDEDSLDEIIPFDKDLIQHYNTLTNLTVELTDGLPQYLCGDCVETINKYMEFRNNCIAVESSLRFIFDQKLNTSIADETPSLNVAVNELEIKQEIKTEVDFIEDYYEPCLDHADSDLHLEDEKSPVRKSCRTKAKKITFAEKINKVEAIKQIKEKNRREVKEAAKQEMLRTQCGICNQTAIGDEALNDHLKTHMNDKECKCNLCSEEFERWPTLLVHRFTHTDRKNKDCRCHLCSKTFKSLLFMEFHYLNTHYEGEQKEYKCPLCSRYFRTIHTFNIHQKLNHPTDKSTWSQCEICSKTFYYKGLYEKHMISHNVTRAYKCDMCDYAAKTKPTLISHVKGKHTASVNCASCGRWLDDRQDYAAHRAKCLPKHMTMCVTCGKQCPSRAFAKHMRTHEAEPAFKCSLCPKTFRNSTNLRNHVDRHQGNKRHHCNICDFRCYNGSVLIKHRRIHTGEKPYVCELCTKGFTSNHNLKVHMKVHGIDAFAKNV